MSPCPTAGTVTIEAFPVIDDASLTLYREQAGNAAYAADYLFRFIDDMMTANGSWFDPVRAWRQGRRRARMARKKRRGWA